MAQRTTTAGYRTRGELRGNQNFGRPALITCLIHCLISTQAESHMWEVFRGAAAGPKRELVEKEARGAARGAAPDGAREAALASGPRVGEDQRFREGGARRLNYSGARAATSGRSRVGGWAARPDRQEEEYRGAEEGVSRLLGGTPRTASRRVGALEVRDADGRLARRDNSQRAVVDARRWREGRRRAGLLGQARFGRGDAGRRRRRGVT